VQSSGQPRPKPKEGGKGTPPARWYWKEGSTTRETRKGKKIIRERAFYTSWDKDFNPPLQGGKGSGNKKEDKNDIERKKNGPRTRWSQEKGTWKKEEQHNGRKRRDPFVSVGGFAWGEHGFGSKKKRRNLLAPAA